MQINPRYPVRARLAEIPDGERGTKATLNMMAALVRAYRTHPQIRTLAETIIVGVPEKDSLAEATAIHQWVRDNIRYTADVNNVETLKDPLVLLQSRFGDCDDKTVLAATLLESIGLHTRLVAVALHGGDYSHVFPDVEIDGIYYPVETTENVSFGWFPEGITKFLRVPV